MCCQLPQDHDSAQLREMRRVILATESGTRESATRLPMHLNFRLLQMLLHSLAQCLCAASLVKLEQLPRFRGLIPRIPIPRTRRRPLVRDAVKLRGDIGERLAALYLGLNLNINAAPGCERRLILREASLDVRPYELARSEDGRIE